MVKSPDRREGFARFCRAFEKKGLVVLGGLILEASDCPQERPDLVGKPALLIGNQGRAMWKHFARSLECRNRVANPLDRWTLRMLKELSGALECQIFHPSHKPYFPFQRIASRVCGIQPSPIGILMHPEFGLWHGLRGLLVFERDHEFLNHINAINPQADELIHPCDHCLEKPCLNACPVDAFTGQELRVDACFGHLDSGAKPECMSTGCRARDACPVGTAHRNEPAQIKFHMQAYRG